MIQGILLLMLPGFLVELALLQQSKNIMFFLIQNSIDCQHNRKMTISHSI